MILIKSLEKEITPGDVVEVDTFNNSLDMDIRQPMVKRQVVRARLFRDRWDRDVSIGCTKEVLADLQIIFDTIDDQAKFINDLNNQLNSRRLFTEKIIDNFDRYKQAIGSMSWIDRLVFLFRPKSITDKA